VIVKTYLAHFVTIPIPANTQHLPTLRYFHLPSLFGFISQQIILLPLLPQPPLLGIASKIENSFSTHKSPIPESHNSFPQVNEMSRRIDAPPYVSKYVLFNLRDVLPTLFAFLATVALRVFYTHSRPLPRRSRPYPNLLLFPLLR
jgi:hypothetical protein